MTSLVHHGSKAACGRTEIVKEQYRQDGAVSAAVMSQTLRQGHQLHWLFREGHGAPGVIELLTSS